jgi:hypothetical protein
MSTAQPDGVVYACCLNCTKRIVLFWGSSTWVHAFNGREDCP